MQASKIFPHLMVAVLGGVIAVLWLTACAKKPDPVPVWGYQADGIRIHYTADKVLNAVDGRPHALLLAVYQLENPNAFNQFSSYPEGIKKLLEADGIDPSVLAVERTFIEPGQSDTIVLSRAEKAKWIGVVAGYYHMAPGKATRTYEITVKVESSGLVFKKREARIQPVNLELILGPQSIEELKAR